MLTITPHLITVIKRHFEVEHKNIIREGLKCPNSDVVISGNSYGNPSAKINVHINSFKNEHIWRCSHHDDCKDNSITAEEKKCEECGETHGITFRLIIFVNLRNDKRSKYLEKIYFTEDTTLEEMLEKLEKISGKTYDFCICGNTAFKDGLCTICYIHQYTRTEEEGGNCAICYENGGRWCEFDKCKHQFHRHCLDKLEKKYVRYVEVADIF